MAIDFERPISLPAESSVEEILFECSLPTEQPTIERIAKPLPFSSSISENLAWATAFIDRAGHLTEVNSFQRTHYLYEWHHLTRWQGYELLEKRLHAAIDTIGNDAIEMTLLRQQFRDQSHKVEQLESTVTRQVREQQELEQRLASTRSTAIRTERDLASKLRIAEKALQQSKAAEGRLKSKLDKTLLEEHERWKREAEHDRDDHASLDAAHDALEKALQDKAALQSELDVKIQELTVTKHELTATQDALGNCKTACEEKNSRIDTLTQQLATANRTNTELSASIQSATAQLTSKGQEIADLTESLSQANSNLATANQVIAQKDSVIATLEASLAGVQEERDQKLKLLEDLQQSTQATQKALQDKIDELSTHDLEDHQRLEAATEAKRLSDESIKDLQAKVDAANAHDADVQRRLQVEEEAKRAAEAELERVKLQLEEANKPKLPNTVVRSC
jgi:chromosome segregation ATPase